MAKYLENSKELEDYTRHQLEIFKKKTGLLFNAQVVAASYISALALTTQQNAPGNEGRGYQEFQKHMDEAYEERNLWLFNMIIGNDVVKEEDFSSLMFAFFEMNHKINSAYKQEHGIGIEPTPENTHSNFTRDSYEECYKKATQKELTYQQQYNEELDKVTKGKSAKLVEDMNTRLANYNGGSDIQEIAATYNALKAKQKKNSFFTNWFTKKGYQERAAMKAAKAKVEALYQKTSFDGNPTFDRLMERHGNGIVKPIIDFLEERHNKRDKMAKLDYELFRKANEGQRQEEIENTKSIFQKDGELIDVDVENEKAPFVLGNEPPSFEKQKEIDAPEASID